MTTRIASLTPADQLPAHGVARAPLAPAVFGALDRARSALLEAATADEAPARYVAAHVAALRATAAVFSTRAAPTRRRGRWNAWTLLVRVAPELAEWAAYFEAGARKRAAAEAGFANAVTRREADDLLRAAECFIAVVEQTLGVPPAAFPLADTDRAPVARAS